MDPVKTEDDLNSFLNEVKQETTGMDYDQKFDTAQNLLNSEEGLEDFLIAKDIGSPVEWLTMRI